MAEITLKSGKVVTIDVSQMTVKEWRDFVSPKSTVNDENVIVMKCTGLKLEEIENMPFVEFKSIAKGIILAAQNPLSDPN